MAAEPKRAQSAEGGLSPSTVRYVHAVIRKALGDAVRWNLVARNVADAADPPRQKRTQMQTWNAEQLRTFLESVQGDPLYTAFALAATTGMRRGEVLGLTWKNVDLAAARVSITQALTVVGGYELQFPEPKTASGRRMIALDLQTVDALREHRAAQLVDCSLMGDAYQDQDLVFADGDGTPIHPRSFSRAFVDHVKRVGVRRIRLHDLRHTHATLALEAGVHPKVVSERLGHASVTITLDTYSHALRAMQKAAASLVASLVFDA